MSKLALHLPPFAPDYSGVCSALFELGGLIVIHDASGCTGNYTGYDEPRWYGSQSLVFCSNLRELDVVMGSDDALISKVLRAAADTTPRFIAVLGSPVPMLIGADIPGIAAEIQAQSGIPSFGFNTTGLAYYDKGISAALVTFAKTFVTKQTHKVLGRVNLLGVTPLDFGNANTLRSLTALLTKRDLEVNCCFAMDCDFDRLCDAASAQVNLVLSSSGLALAEYFHRQFDIPYCVGLPIGTVQTERIIAQLKGSCASTPLPVEKSVPAPCGKRILIIGEQVIAHSLRVCLREDYGFADITVVSPFTQTKALAEEQDRSIDDERALQTEINAGYDIVIADPLLAQLLAPGAPTRFISLPHLAISSKLHWDESIDLIAEGRCLLLDRCLAR